MFQANKISVKQQVLAVILAILVINLIPYLWGRLSALNSPVRTISIADTPPVYSGMVRVVSYNIAHGRGGQYGADNWNGESKTTRIQRLRAIADFFKQAEIYVVVLNEVDFDADWSHNINQAEFIAQYAGFSHRVEQRNFDLYHPFFKLRFGNAILSRYPIVSTQPLLFTPFSQLEKWFLGNHDGLLAEIVLNENKTLKIAALHLEVRDKESRLQTVSALQRLLVGDQAPTVLAGDFNSIRSRQGEKGTVVDKLTRLPGVNFYPTDSVQNYTFPSQQPNRTIDWVMAPPGVSFVEGSVVQLPLSDHLPVVADLEI